MKLLFGLLSIVGFLFASVDINSANQKDFTTLNGVGEKRASAIIAYRQANGCFKTIDELAKVKGISVKIIEKNRDKLNLGECKN